MGGIFAILCMGLLITITIVWQKVKQLIFHGDNKCITANGQTIINVGTDIKDNSFLVAV